jgi:WG containing repeat
MKYYLLAIVLILLNLGSSYAQDNGVWTLFQDKDTELIGYKDSRQNIRIPPKFTFAEDREFRNIIAVYENTGNDNYTGYYLLKTGEKVGINNVYLWDNAPDCEREEKIRFRDKNTGFVGFFDKSGKIIVPARYNDATPFRNGMAVVLKNAEKVCQNGEAYSEKNKCEHPTWKGGQTHIIDENNNILVENIKYERNLDWFSLKIMEIKDNDLIRETYQGVNGKYYSIVNFDKEFDQWFKLIFLSAKDSKTLKGISFTDFSFWSDTKSDWIKIKGDELIENNNGLILKQIAAFREKKLQYSIHKSNNYPHPFDSKNHAKYFDSCGNSKDWKYPVFSVHVASKDANGFIELDPKNYFEFLKTENGYKMIRLGIRDTEFKTE